MAVEDITEVQRGQADRVGQNMRTYVDKLQELVFAAADKDEYGRVIATTPLAVNGDELLALQGLITMFNGMDSFVQMVGRRKN